MTLDDFRRLPTLRFLIFAIISQNSTDVQFPAGPLELPSRNDNCKNPSELSVETGPQINGKYATLEATQKPWISWLLWGLVQLLGHDPRFAAVFLTYACIDFTFELWIEYNVYFDQCMLYACLRTSDCMALNYIALKNMCTSNNTSIHKIHV